MSHTEALGVAIRELRRRRNNVQRHGSVNLERVGYLAELATAIAVLETIARLIESAGFS